MSRWLLLVGWVVRWHEGVVLEVKEADVIAAFSEDLWGAFLYSDLPEKGGDAARETARRCDR
jgi:hypothetical protein